MKRENKKQPKFEKSSHEKRILFRKLDFQGTNRAN